jgi:hypothetical protein
VLIETSTMSQIVTREQRERGVPEAVDWHGRSGFGERSGHGRPFWTRMTEIARIAAAGLGEAAFTDDSGLSRKVWMPVLESHARNRPHSVDFSNEAAIRDDRT